MPLNVADLIEELKKLPPLQPVRLVVVGAGGGWDLETEGFETADAEGELQDVSFQGNHIRLEAR